MDKISLKAPAKINLYLKVLGRREDGYHEIESLMQAIDLQVPGAGLVADLRENGLLVNCTADTVLRFIPPLIVTREEIDEMIHVLDAALGRIQGG